MTDQTPTNQQPEREPSASACSGELARTVVRYVGKTDRGYEVVVEANGQSRTLEAWFRPDATEARVVEGVVESINYELRECYE